jgi:hypothetical protein
MTAKNFVAGIVPMTATNYQNTCHIRVSARKVRVGISGVLLCTYYKLDVLKYESTDIIALS